MAKLDGKFCVITGAARGIGYALAEAFLKEGGRVLLTDANEAAGKDAAHRLNCEFFALDVTEEADWDRLLASFPQTDVMVNNAGVTGFAGGMVPHDPEHATLEDWRAVHRINLDGTFLGCRYAIRAMKAKGTGSIINMSSRAGLSGVANAAAYASSKAAIRNHTKSVALYCAEQGWNIRCNSVHPSAVLTPIWDPILGEGAQRQQRMTALSADTPLKRFALPEEIAPVCVLLASDESAFISGSEFTIDGGLSAGMPSKRA